MLIGDIPGPARGKPISIWKTLCVLFSWKLILGRLGTEVNRESSTWTIWTKCECDQEQRLVHWRDCSSPQDVDGGLKEAALFGGGVVGGSWRRWRTSRKGELENWTSLFGGESSLEEESGKLYQWDTSQPNGTRWSPFATRVGTPAFQPPENNESQRLVSSRQELACPAIPGSVHNNKVIVNIALLLNKGIMGPLLVFCLNEWHLQDWCRRWGWIKGSIHMPEARLNERNCFRLNSQEN